MNASLWCKCGLWCERSYVSVQCEHGCVVGPSSTSAAAPDRTNSQPQAEMSFVPTELTDGNLGTVFFQRVEVILTMKPLSVKKSFQLH